MTASVEERVAAGVKWLDRNVPDWRERVEVRSFDIKLTCKCILGQVFREKAEEERHLWPEGFAYAVDELIGYEEAAEMGFDLPEELTINPVTGLPHEDAEQEWKLLQGEWLRVLLCDGPVH